MSRSPRTILIHPKYHVRYSYSVQYGLMYILYRLTQFVWISCKVHPTMNPATVPSPTSLRGVAPSLNHRLPVWGMRSALLRSPALWSDASDCICSKKPWNDSRICTVEIMVLGYGRGWRKDLSVQRMIRVVQVNCIRLNAGSITKPSPEHIPRTPVTDTRARKRIRWDDDDMISTYEIVGMN